MKLHGMAWQIATGIVVMTFACLPGCGGSNPAPTENSQVVIPAPVVEDPVQPTGGMGSLLPAPSSLQDKLKQGKGVSYVEADLEKLGNDFELSLPRANVIAHASDAQFTSTWQPGSALSNIAYCMYHFTASGYDRNAQVRLITSSSPLPDPDDVWLALADWDGDRWTWFGSSTVSGSEFRFDLASLEPYFDFGGDMLIVVAMTAMQASPTECNVAKVRLGADPPAVELVVTPAVGAVPLAVSLDSSGSTSLAGTITKYEWDFDGDGTFDADTGATATADHEYTVNGSYTPTVRVTNSLGASADGTATVYAVGDWSHTWGRSDADDIRHIATDSAGFIYGVGTTNKVSGPLESDLLLMKWTPTGEVVWAKTLDSGSSDYGLNITFNTTGELITVGGTDASGSRQVLVTKWDTDGSVIWCRTCGGAGFDQAAFVTTDETDIYVAGSTSSATATNDVFILKYLDNGTLDWQMSFDHGDNDYMTDFAPMWNFVTGTTGLTSIFDYKSGSNYYICKLEVGLTGALSSAKSLNGTALPMSGGHLVRTYSLVSPQSAYYTAGVVSSGGEKIFLSRTDGLGNSTYCTLLTTSNTAQLEDLSFDSDGKLLVSGFGKTAGTLNDALLYRFDPIDGSYLGAHAWGLQDRQCRGYGLLFYQGGFLLSGYGKDATASYIAPSCTTTATNWNYTDTSVNSTTLNWFASDLPNTVEDITSAGVLDTGGGGDDCLLLHRVGF